jgi:hypothetical protein
MARDFFLLVNRDEWEVFNLKFLGRFSQRIYVYRAIITVLFSMGEFINPIYTKFDGYIFFYMLFYKKFVSISNCIYYIFYIR